MSRHLVRAPAKINLGLKVLGKRLDGFHNIQSIFQTIDLFDKLLFEPVAQEGIEVVCDTLPTGQENLVFQAADAMWKLGRPENGIRITLTKGIPVGAGLGGGSSDAAAVILALDSLWQVGLSDVQFIDVAESLGSDVPFFLQGGTALVSGRGEHIQFVDWSENFHYVLVYPNIEISSSWAYQNLRIGLTGSSVYSRFLHSVEDSGNCCPDSLLACLENDFMPLVEDNFPVVGRVLDELAQAGAVASSLSGSGSALYGVFRDQSQAQKALVRLRSLGYPVYHCHSWRKNIDVSGGLLPE